MDKKKSHTKKTKTHSKKHSEPEPEEHVKVSSAKKDKSTYIFIGVVAALIVGIILIAFLIDKTSPETDDPQGPSDIAAKVNGEQITLEDLDEQFSIYAGSSVSKEQILDQMINEKIVLQQAQKAGIRATEEQVEQVISEALDATGMTQESLMANLEEQGITYEELVEINKNRIIIDEYINQTVLSEVVVSDEEVDDYFNQYFEQFEEVNVSHILVNSTELAEEIIAKLDAGENFADLAGEFGTDATKNSGGSLGFFTRGVMVTEFETVAFSLNVGEYTKTPVETRFGYHIVMKTGERTEEYYKASIKEMLFSQQAQTKLQNHLTMLRTAADVEVLYEEESDFDFEQAKACLAKYGMTGDEVVFLYSDSCPHCQNMKPIVTELENSGKKFKWISGASNDMQIINDCLDSLLTSNGVPQFICPKEGKVKLGAQDKEVLADFC